MSDLPDVLVPDSGERGMASADRDELRRLSLSTWDAFLDQVRGCDLDAATRRAEISARMLLVPLGAWPTSRLAAAVVADARAGRVGTLDQDAEAARLRRTHADASAADVIAALQAARDDVASFLGSPDDDVDGLRPTASPLGALPIRTLVLAGAYQLAVSALDLEPASAGPAPPLVLRNGLVALVDATGALAARQRVDGSLTALLPDEAWGFGARAGDWRTRSVTPAQAGPAVEGAARTIVDITAGRVSDVPGMYRRGEIRLHDIPGLLPMAAIADAVPGIPGSTALRHTARVLGAATKITRLFSRRS